jgi:hypothetical protein
VSGSRAPISRSIRRLPITNPMEPKFPGSKPTSKARRATLAGLLSSRQFEYEVKSRPTLPEVQSRLRIEEAQSAHERRKDLLILMATLIALALVVISCLVVVFQAGPSEDKKWAMSVIASIVSGGIGYLTGKSSK